jgi:hypothetical protein
VDRHADVRHHAQRGERRVGERRVRAGVGHHQRAAARHRVLTQRVRERHLTARRPRLGQPDLARDHLPIAIDQRHQRDRCGEQARGERREIVEGLVGGRRREAGGVERGEAIDVVQPGHAPA